MISGTAPFIYGQNILDTALNLVSVLWLSMGKWSYSYTNVYNICNIMYCKIILYTYSNHRVEMYIDTESQMT